MKQITRTITFTKAKYCLIKVANGDIVKGEPEEINFNEKLSEKEIIKKLSKTKDGTIAVLEIKYDEKVYGASIDDFMQIAEEIERPESQRKQVEGKEK